MFTTLFGFHNRLSSTTSKEASTSAQPTVHFDASGNLFLPAYIKQTGTYAQMYEVYTYGVNPNPPLPDIPVPTATDATNSAKTWQPAGTIQNTDFASNLIAHAGGYIYVPKKDGNNIQIVRYQDKVASDGTYPLDTSFTPLDLTDENENKLDFNTADSGYMILRGLDVDKKDGTVYAWVGTNRPTGTTKVTVDDYIYFYQNGSCKAVQKKEQVNLPGVGDLVYGIKALSEGGVMISDVNTPDGNSTPSVYFVSYRSDGTVFGKIKVQQKSTKSAAVP